MKLKPLILPAIIGILVLSLSLQVRSLQRLDRIRLRHIAALEATIVHNDETIAAWKSLERLNRTDGELPERLRAYAVFSEGKCIRIEAIELPEGQTAYALKGEQKTSAERIIRRLTNPISPINK